MEYYVKKKADELYNKLYMADIMYGYMSYEYQEVRNELNALLKDESDNR